MSIVSKKPLKLVHSAEVRDFIEEISKVKDKTTYEVLTTQFNESIIYRYQSKVHKDSSRTQHGMKKNKTNTRRTQGSVSPYYNSTNKSKLTSQTIFPDSVRYYSADPTLREFYRVSFDPNQLPKAPCEVRALQTNFFHHHQQSIPYPAPSFPSGINNSFSNPYSGIANFKMKRLKNPIQKSIELRNTKEEKLESLKPQIFSTILNSKSETLENPIVPSSYTFKEFKTFYAKRE